MKMKKSAGPDEISQECLLIGKSILAKPLTAIINESIKQGCVPDSWKEAVVIPILKKGDAQNKENYRPVSCLTAASKVLEKVVCEQMTSYLEENNLLPENHYVRLFKCTYHHACKHFSLTTSHFKLLIDNSVHTNESLINTCYPFDL